MLIEYVLFENLLPRYPVWTQVDRTAELLGVLVQLLLFGHLIFLNRVFVRISLLYPLRRLVRRHYYISGTVDAASGHHHTARDQSTTCLLVLLDIKCLGR